MWPWWWGGDRCGRRPALRPGEDSGRPVCAHQRSVWNWRDPTAHGPGTSVPYPPIPSLGNMAISPGFISSCLRPRWVSPFQEFCLSGPQISPWSPRALPRSWLRTPPRFPGSHFSYLVLPLVPDSSAEFSPHTLSQLFWALWPLWDDGQVPCQLHSPKPRDPTDSKQLPDTPQASHWPWNERWISPSGPAPHLGLLLGDPQGTDLLFCTPACNTWVPTTPALWAFWCLSDSPFPPSTASLRAGLAHTSMSWVVAVASLLVCATRGTCPHPNCQIDLFLLRKFWLCHSCVCLFHGYPVVLHFKSMCVTRVWIYMYIHTYTTYTCLFM